LESTCVRRMYQVLRLRVLSSNITMTILLLWVYGIVEVTAVYTESNCRQTYKPIRQIIRYLLCEYTVFNPCYATESGHGGSNLEDICLYTLDI
jgi:hypothetical protein